MVNKFQIKKKTKKKQYFQLYLTENPMLCRFNKEKRVYMSVLFNVKMYVYLVYGTDLVLLLLCLLFN